MCSLYGLSLLIYSMYKCVHAGFLCTLVGFVSQSLNSRLPSSSLWLSDYSVRQLDLSLCSMVSVDLLLCSGRVASLGCFLLEL